MRQRHPGLLDLTAQRDAALGFGLAPLLQRGAALFAQRLDPGPPAGGLDLAVEPPRHRP
ncbi:hypothetical protein O983_00565 [Mycobacterium avium 09-5983]|nr:hypothetical protein O983_00565 [Mycobacterium avium 09-5983]